MSQIVPNVRIADEFLEGTEDILSRIPEEGYKLDNSNVWFVPSRTVDLALYYAFDEDHVYFLSIEKAIPPQL